MSMMTSHIMFEAQGKGREGACVRGLLTLEVLLSGVKGLFICSAWDRRSGESCLPADDLS
jgi:hypothetical protein